MNLDKVIDENKKKLAHGKHGGEIFNKSIKNPNSLLDFSTNINHLATPDLFSQVYQNSIKNIPRYPDSNSTKLKQELVNYFKNRIGVENVIIGAGSMEIISIFCDMFINSGDDVIIHQPTFSEYEWAVKKNNGNIINVYRKPENQFQIESKSLIEEITQKTRAIFLCNPNNPNGLLDSSETIEKIIKTASKNNIFVLLDEAFIEFTGESNSFVYKISSFDNLYICRSFTKFFGLTGLRVGYGISSPEIIDVLKRGQLLWSVNCIGQNLAQEVLKSKKLIDDSFNFFSKECEFMKREFEKISQLKIFPSNTNYFLINIEKTGLKAAELKEYLLKEEILIRDCSNYDGLNDYYIRVSVKTRESNQKLIDSLKNIINKGNNNA